MKLKSLLTSPRSLRPLLPRLGELTAVRGKTPAAALLTENVDPAQGDSVVEHRGTGAGDDESVVLLDKRA